VITSKVAPLLEQQSVISQCGLLSFLHGRSCIHSVDAHIPNCSADHPQGVAAAQRTWTASLRQACAGAMQQRMAKR
jgi:hypothetical protein